MNIKMFGDESICSCCGQSIPRPNLLDKFFGYPLKALARLTDPDTSHAAAKTVDPTALEQLVYKTISEFPAGCIADDVVRKTMLRWDTVTPRFAPLIKKGFIYDTGERRRAASGRSQRVLKVVK